MVLGLMVVIYLKSHIRERVVGLFRPNDDRTGYRG